MDSSSNNIWFDSTRKLSRVWHPWLYFKYTNILWQNSIFYTSLKWPIISIRSWNWHLSIPHLYYIIHPYQIWTIPLVNYDLCNTIISRIWDYIWQFLSCFMRQLYLPFKLYAIIINLLYFYNSWKITIIHAWWGVLLPARTSDRKFFL